MTDATSGRRRPDTGKSGKSEFPAGRSDNSIIHDILDNASEGGAETVLRAMSRPDD